MSEASKLAVPTVNSSQSVPHPGNTHGSSASLHSDETTATAAAASTAAAGTVDMEKQAVKHEMPTFPEGSLKGWLTVAGAWLIML